MKHQKDIQAKLSLHIYKYTNTHMNTAIDQLIAGSFLFDIWSCKYSTTPKHQGNAHASFRKGIYVFVENVADFHKTVGSSIWKIRSP